MTAAVLRRFDLQKLQLNRTQLGRMLFVGVAWGVAMSAGLAGLTYWNCGMVCPDDIAITTMISVSTGILAIGPLAAYGRR